ncbi:PTS sugar transporter subunit IIA [Cellulomonas carbonis T26]|uniref:Phosphocarrier protein HPr n=1 Tax=Cellulomonas carbonis T26 TaxID=947969 RepID=A0A0A0BU81_9CELL|nr:PTS sugar transporter subunit IIA [Cellulomonas carbonis T26]
MARVALVLVSHSRAAAEGVAEIAAQMAPDVAIVAAGGMPEGIGTSFERVLDAIEEGAAAAQEGSGADGGGVAVLTDLGSAVLTTESVLEAVDEDVAARVRLVDGPFLEGAVAAAVRAQQGGDLDEVVTAGEAAGDWSTSRTSGPRDGAASAGAPDAAGAAAAGEAVRRTVVLRNPLGLHARPAALLARAVADLGVPLTVDGVDGASVLALMALGAAGGHELVVEASGPGAAEAVDAVVRLVDEGFGEV